MEYAPGLLALPLEVLTHIGQYLSPRLLYDVSATCQRLRTAVNNNSIWRRHSRGVLVSQLPEHAPSLVEPTFSVPVHDTLDPLCDHRLHFIRHSRLLRNLRQGKYVHHVISAPEDRFYQCYVSRGRVQVIYKNDYVFIAGYILSAESRQQTYIYVYDIREEPRQVAAFKVGDEQPEDHFRLVQVNVVGDKLVILYADGFRVHQIDLPSAKFPVIFSWVEFGNTYCDGSIFLNNFVIETPLGIVNIWDINTSEKCVLESPEGRGDAHILNLSTGEGLILLYFGEMGEDGEGFGVDGEGPDIHVYDVSAQQYTSFHVRLDDSYCICSGVVGNSHVVLFVGKGSDSYLDDFDSVSVYNCETSDLIVRKTELILDDESHIIKDCLLIPNTGCIKVFSLCNLELLYEMPYSGQRQFTVNILKGLCDLVIIGRDVWDFDQRRKLFRLDDELEPKCESINENCSKIISMDSVSRVHVYSFW